MFPRHDGQAASGGRRGQKGVGDVVVERFASPTLLFHDLRARSGVVGGPTEYALVEALVQDVPKPGGKALAPLTGIETADAVQDLPDGDG